MILNTIIQSYSRTNIYYFFFINMYPQWIFVFLFNSVTCDTFSSDILIYFGVIDLYSVVDWSSSVSFWSSLIDVAASDLSRMQLLRNMIF